MNPEFWRGKRVFLTGHTGFKGAWLGLWLEQLGADVTGFSLAPNTTPALFELLAPWHAMDSIIADVRDRTALDEAMASAEPHLVVHMAAQPLVRRSYEDPIETFDTNAIGTANLLETVRSSPSVQAVLVVTSDKVYDQDYGAGNFIESDRLGGFDPYSASKAMQELVTASFRRSFLDEAGVPVATARAGNVIGGGDWAADRLVPDYFRSVASGEPFVLRYPAATRPWQHVLEPLSGYLVYLEHLTDEASLPGSLNFGPTESPVSVAELITRLASASEHSGEWVEQEGETWPEHAELRLDSNLATKALGWQPVLSLDEAVGWTAEWYGAHRAGDDLRALSIEQIGRFTRRIV